MALTLRQVAKLAHISPENQSLKKNPSDASISTRAPTRISSNNSLFDGAPPHQQAKAEDHEEEGSASETIVTKLAFTRRHVLLAFVALVASFAWSRYMRRIINSSREWGYGRLSLMLGAAITSVARAIGVTGSSQFKQDPSSVPQKQILACLHPHGCFGLGCISNLSGEPRSKHSPLKGIFMGVADVLFGIPFVREFLLLLNARPASAKMLELLLADGKSVALYPGGMHEQMATDSTQERLFFPPNLGFVRQAMQHGVPLVPVYNFGENQVVGVPEWSRQATQVVKDYTGFAIPLPIGRWGLPFVPRATHVETRMGGCVDVGSANSEPSDAHVREVFIRYCAELHRLFNEHSARALPSKVAAKGLTLVWRGHEAEDLSDESVKLALQALGARSSSKRPLSGTPALSRL